MTPSWAQPLAAPWQVVWGGERGAPLDESKSVRLVGPTDGALTARLAAALDDARARAADELTAAATVRDGERALPTSLGGDAVWRRACAVAERAAVAVGDPYAVVVVRPPAAERALLRSELAIRAAIRSIDVLTRDTEGFRLLVPRCTASEAAGLAARLVHEALDVGVTVGAGAAEIGGEGADAAVAEAVESAVRTQRAHRVVALDDA